MPMYYWLIAVRNDIYILTLPLAHPTIAQDVGTRHPCIPLKAGYLTFRVDQHVSLLSSLHLIL
ncbi:hypothetical protein BDN70DRAFT_881882, partial [Pholiota conissans]